MQPEFAMGAARPAGLWDWRRWWRRCTGGLALGASAKPALPDKPTILHPVEKLTLHNCGLFELYRGQPARPYLPLPGIEVVKKVSLAELRDGRCEYRFELNAPADGIWRCFFQRLFPSAEAQLDNKFLVIVCAPQALEAIYSAVKEAMLVANEWYAGDRDLLVPLVMALDEHRRAVAELEENRRLGLRNHFEGLEL